MRTLGSWISSEGSLSRRAWLRPFCCLARRGNDGSPVSPNYKTNAAHSVIIQLADVPTVAPPPPVHRVLFSLCCIPRYVHSYKSCCDIRIRTEVMKKMFSITISINTSLLNNLFTLREEFLVFFCYIYYIYYIYIYTYIYIYIYIYMI